LSSKELHRSAPIANRLDGKGALITRGSRGFGAAIALRFAAEGARAKSVTDEAIDQILKPGAKAPAFTLKNQHGEDVSFLLDVVARKGSEERHASARGRDIYAISAPVVVEATQRIVTGMVKKSGVVTAGEAFDAREFLESLHHPTHLSIEMQ
jgi:NAD(P)-dependent dehydrogenase (short-subunit alcohol dehydrogenase family)